MFQWSIIFWFSSGVYVFGALVFLFVNTEPEKWAIINSDKTSDKIANEMESNKIKEMVDPMEAAEVQSLSRMRSRTYSIIG